MELLKREMSQRANCAELIETRSNLVGQLESKVDLHEVQAALNDCQADIVKQLDQFKEAVKEEIQEGQADVLRQLDCKADAIDM